MFGKNKILKPQNHDGSSLEVQEIFATFQGEGPFVGYPSVFVRLGGCNLACNFCDTEFDSFTKMSLEKILSEVEKLAKNSEEKIVRNLVVITGGEPFRQPIERLCQELIARKFLVQIETNGTIFRNLPDEVKIICSPKVVQEKYHKIRPDLLLQLDAIKFIISDSQENYRNIADVGQNDAPNKIAIYVQPMDEYNEQKNQANIARALEIASKNGARISLQIHKILNIA